MHKPFTPISSKTAFSCPWYRVRQDAIYLPDGTVGQYNVVEAPECVFVVPVTTDGNIVLIHQYRYTVDAWVWEVPAGAIHAGQSPLDAARQELQEEVGGTSDHFTFLGKINTANGRSNELAHLYVAWDVVLGENKLESAEILTVHPTPTKTAIEMVYNNQIEDGPSALAILLAAPHLKL